MEWYDLHTAWRRWPSVQCNLHGLLLTGRAGWTGSSLSSSSGAAHTVPSRSSWGLFRRLSAKHTTPQERSFVQALAAYTLKARPSASLLLGALFLPGSVGWRNPYPHPIGCRLPRLRLDWPAIHQPKPDLCSQGPPINVDGRSAAQPQPKRLGVRRLVGALARRDSSRGTRRRVAG